MSKNKSHNLTVVGKKISVTDAKAKVTGNIRYAIDHVVPGMVFGKILRSPHAHARIRMIETAQAEALPGVIGVVTHQDAPDRNWESCWFNYRGHILDDRVRFVGDEVAAVAAVDEDTALKAVELIEVDYEVLPAVFDAQAAMKPDAPQVRSEGNVREPRIVSWGDVDKGPAASDIVAESTMAFGSQQFAPIGRNACIAEWTEDRVTMWTSTQTPSECQTSIAQAFGIPINRVHVIGLPSGCSFGLWWVNNFHLLTVLLAKKVQRPVKIVLSQEECFAAVKRRHLERSEGRIGCKKDGTIVFLDIKHIIDSGGYGFKPDVGFFCCDTWGRSPHGRFYVQPVSTNLLTAGCMRGVGDVTMGAFVERLLDMAAIELDMDPLTFRLKNHLRAGEPLRKIPVHYTVQQIPLHLRDEWPVPNILSSEALHECLMKGAEAFHWKNKWKGWGKPLMVDGPKRRAVGVATGTHCNGVQQEGNVAAIVRVHADGSATLCCSIGRQGQGSETTQAQIASETLGIAMEKIEVQPGDTEACPWSHGSIASNTAYRMGYATWAACLDARRQILEIAARHYLKGEPDELEIKNGVIYKKSDRDLTINLEDLMSKLMPDALSAPVIVGRTAKQMPPSTTFSRHFGAHFAEVEVNTDTGQITILDYLAAQDSGTVLNPAVLENQVIGGAIAGSGFALVESLVFDEQTGKIMNPSFTDYKVLRAPDFPLQPKVIFCESFDPAGPYGAKGGGEAPIAASVPTIAQAVYNAIGVWIDVPMTPERVLKALGKL